MLHFRNFFGVCICLVFLVNYCLTDSIGLDLEGKVDLQNFVYEFEKSDDRIFVFIAAFLDPELAPTIKDFLEKAKYPDRFDFGILIQQDPESPPEFPWEGLPNFKVVRIPYLESRGVGWARTKGAELYGGQKYLLQLDSHHRFARNWDEKILEIFGRCLETGHPKPILSTYLDGYSPRGHYENPSPPRKVISERIYDTGKVRFVGSSDGRHATEPIPSAIISAHFIFTYGKWLDEVPYDPLVYFDGEEDTLSVRSWTRGWDIFSPTVNVIWHLYGRENQKKHWDVHPDWWKIKQISEARVRGILHQEPSSEDYGIYGIGDNRSYEDFQEFSGLYFPKWHLGKRALTGDLSIAETNPPPAEYPPKCKYNLSGGGVFIEIGMDVWHERHSGSVWTFRKFKKEDNGDLILFDASRGMYMKLTTKDVSWGETKRADKAIEKWNRIHDVQSIECEQQ